MDRDQGQRPNRTDQRPFSFSVAFFRPLGACALRGPPWRGARARDKNARKTWKRVRAIARDRALAKIAAMRLKTALNCPFFSPYRHAVRFCAASTLERFPSARLRICAKVVLQVRLSCSAARWPVRIDGAALA